LPSKIPGCLHEKEIRPLAILSSESLDFRGALVVFIIVTFGSFRCCTYLVTPLGASTFILIVVTRWEIGTRAAGRRRGMVDPKGLKATIAADGVRMLAKNAINVAMEDRTEADMKVVEHEL
jgi:hypothetical protein